MENNAKLFTKKFSESWRNSMKITGILLNTPLYTSEPIIVPSAQTETCSSVLCLPR